MKGDVIPVLRNLNHWPRFRLRLFVEGGIVGILSGSIISFFGGPSSREQYSDNTYMTRF